MGPFWRYYGGKWRSAPRYPAPECGLIIEAFAGASGYACRYPDRDVLLIDASPQVVGIWEWLIQANAEDVRAVPDIPLGGTVDDIDAPQGARWLAGFWCNGGSASPCKRPGKWARRYGQEATNFAGWGWRVRERIASWVPYIKHWRVMLGDYTDAPDMRATWFVDAPYATKAGTRYPQQVGDRSPEAFGALGAWCRSRQGQVIACDQAGSTWLPWTHTFRARSAATGSHQEVYWHRSTHPALF